LRQLARASVQYYKEGYNCAQSLLLAYGLESGADMQLLSAAAESFGVGMARLGETCGAVAGALMVIGLKHGRREVRDAVATETTYQLAQEFSRRFTDLNGSIRCRELLGYEIGTADGMAAAEANVAFTACPKYVHDAATIIADLIAERGEMVTSGTTTES